MSITIPDPWLMLLVFVVFLITMFLLNTWLFKPLLGFMDERERSLQKDKDSIIASDAHVQEIQTQIRSLFAQAKAEANSIVEQATAQAKADYEAKITKKTLDLQHKLQEFRENLQQQKNKVENELMSDFESFENALKTKVQQI